MIKGKSSNATMSNVTVMNALNDVIVGAEAHSGSAKGVLVRLLKQQRVKMIKDAITLELTNRMNARIANGKALPTDNPRLPVFYLINSISNARDIEIKLLKLTGVSN